MAALHGLSHFMCVQVLEQLKLEPEAAMLTDALLKQAAAVHTVVPAGHHIGTPQVQTPQTYLSAY